MKFRMICLLLCGLCFIFGCSKDLSDKSNLFIKIERVVYIPAERFPIGLQGQKYFEWEVFLWGLEFNRGGGLELVVKKKNLLFPFPKIYNKHFDGVCYTYYQDLKTLETTEPEIRHMAICEFESACATRGSFSMHLSQLNDLIFGREAALPMFAIEAMTDAVDEFFNGIVQENDTPSILETANKLTRPW